MMEYGTGYVHVLDPKEREYELREYMQDAAEPDSMVRLWAAGKPVLNQGSRPSCVGHSCAHYLFAGPVRNRIKRQTTKRVKRNGKWRTVTVTEKLPAMDPIEIWGRSQEKFMPERDPNEGSNTAFALEVLREEGFVGGYVNVIGAGGSTRPETHVRVDKDFQAMCQAILTEGPVVVGTSWQGAMGSPGEDGFMRIDRNAYFTSGHAYLLIGISMTTGNPDLDYVIVLNSWGPTWGGKGGCLPGMARMTLSDLRLLFNWAAKGHLATEMKLA